MEPKFQSSFIPKGPVATNATIPAMGSREKSLLGFLGLVIFVLAVGLSLLVLGYNQFEKYRIKKMGGELEVARTNLELNSIKELSKADARIISAEALLNNNVVLSPLFDFLESSTVKTVRFTEFNLSTTKEGVVLTMKGQARGYSAVALQADIFSKSSNLRNSIFSDLNLDDRGNVIFAMKAIVEPTLLSYSKFVEKMPATEAQSDTREQSGTPILQAPSTSATSTQSL